MSRLMERNLTEFEESLSFDVDDPDFAPNSCLRIASYQSEKSNYIAQVDFDTDSNRFDRMTSIQNTTESLSRHRNNTSLSCHSLYGASEDNYDAGHTQYQGTEVLIENIRLRFNSCFTCGVSWSEEHVSLDCSECGGYSMQRPCPRCNGRCHSSWKRDVDTSHRIREAKWIGECGLACGSMEESLPAVEKLRATS